MTKAAPASPESLSVQGWRSRAGDGFNAQLGNVWFGPDEGRPTVGFFVEERHTNLFGNLHGGALLTFADICLGYGASTAARHKAMVTADLHAQFIAGAKAGYFVQGTPEVVRCTRSLIFVRGLICVGDKTIASADGIWKILEPGA